MDVTLCGHTVYRVTYCKALLSAPHAVVQTRGRWGGRGARVLTVATKRGNRECPNTKTYDSTETQEQKQQQQQTNRRETTLVFGFTFAFKSNDTRVLKNKYRKMA